MLRRLTVLTMILGTLALVGCKIPETKKVFYDNSEYLKEIYSAYHDDGQEVKHGLYVRFRPDGEKEAEIYFQHGEELSKTVYTQEGKAISTAVALNEDR